ncbi:MAG TPA: aldehyde dehydrogenase family protein, partial [Rhodoglobus sp.]|nr:aldehyde dehydrogenase family protein [Rhodoglobus sp.]
MSLGGEHTDLFIGGQWRAASAAGRIDVVNPATEEVWASVPDADAADVDAAVRAARAALPDWRGIGAAARA